MTQRITNTLTEMPSYLKWGNSRLAEKFGCSEVTISKIKKNLSKVKRNYIANLK